MPLGKPFSRKERFRSRAQVHLALFRNQQLWQMERGHSRQRLAQLARRGRQGFPRSRKTRDTPAQPYLPGNSPPLVFNPSFQDETFTLSVTTSIGKTYQLEFKDSLADLTWTPLSQISGTGQALVLTDATATNSRRFYRVRQW
jgi:hypothetical protein